MHQKEKVKKICTTLFKQEESQSFAKTAIGYGPLEALITDDDEYAGQERKVDPNIQDGEKVVVELVLAKDEEHEEVGDDAEDELEDPGEEGHVDVENITLLALPENFRVNDVSDAVGLLYNVAEDQRV